jgi:ABC-type transporter Mla subunit MlaD
MAATRNALRAGIFMVVSLAGGIAIVIGIAGSSRFTEHFTKHLVGFTLGDNVGGLRPGDDVRLGGLKVGAVEAINFVGRGSQGNGQPAVDRIVVTMLVPDQYTIGSDAQVSIETTLTGVTTVNITDLGAGPPLAADAILVGKPDSLSALKASLAALVPKIDRDLDDVHHTLGIYDDAGTKASFEIHSLAADLHVRLKQFTESAVRALDSVHDLLGPSTGDFHQAVANVRDVTGSLKQNVPPIASSIQKLLDHLNATVANAQVVVSDLKPAAANARDTIAALKSIVISNQGRLDEIVAGLKKTSDNLAETSVEVRHSPWRLLYKPSPDEMANLNLYDAARQFADGASNLSDAAVALRDALHDKDADPKRVQKLYDDLSEQFAKFNAAEDDLWKQVKQ